LLARDVILATEPPHAISVRNTISGVVEEISDDEDDARLVRVDIGGTAVLSRVTIAAVDALNLQRGKSVWVLIKAVSLRGHTFAAPVSRSAP
jgi:molybdate transport system ATP-binding protein